MPTMLGVFTSEHRGRLYFPQKYTYVNVRRSTCGMVQMRPRHRMGRVPRGSGIRAPEPLFCPQPPSARSHVHAIQYRFFR